MDRSHPYPLKSLSSSRRGRMVGSIAILLRLLPIPPPRRCTSRGLNHLDHIVVQLRHSGGDVFCEDVAEGTKSVEFSAHELVAVTHELNKLSRVDVRVTAVLDVLEKFWRHGGEIVWRSGRSVKRAEGVGECFAWCLLVR
ncbi:hypothetical protein HG530_003589 [Fusarium avenaceum]|nr:hypothetical protein HG530_003589 [Fusarium avenaceum]